MARFGEHGLTWLQSFDRCLLPTGNIVIIFVYSCEKLSHMLLLNKSGIRHCVRGSNSPHEHSMHIS